MYHIKGKKEALMQIKKRGILSFTIILLYFIQCKIDNLNLIQIYTTAVKFGNIKEIILMNLNCKKDFI